MVIEAKKFTAWYDSAEDRIRLAVNIDDSNSRVDFWITRRLLLTIISQLEDFINFDENEKIDNLIETNSKREINKQSNSNSSSKNEDKSNQEDEDKDIKVSLLRTMNIHWDKKSNKISLSLISDCCQANANLDIVAMNALIKMLLIQAPTLEWGVSSLMLRR